MDPTIKLLVFNSTLNLRKVTHFRLCLFKTQMSELGIVGTMGPNGPKLVKWVKMYKQTYPYGSNWVNMCLNSSK